MPWIAEQSGCRGESTQAGAGSVNEKVRLEGSSFWGGGCGVVVTVIVIVVTVMGLAQWVGGVRAYLEQQKVGFPGRR